MKSTFIWRCPKGTTGMWNAPRRLAGGVRIFASAIGIFLGTVVSTMPQLGLLRQQYTVGKHAAVAGDYVQASPSTHSVPFARAILYRDAGFDVVWLQFVFVRLVGGLFFLLAMLCFGLRHRAGDVRPAYPS